MRTALPKKYQTRDNVRTIAGASLQRRANHIGGRRESPLLSQHVRQRKRRLAVIGRSRQYCPKVALGIGVMPIHSQCIAAPVSQCLRIRESRDCYVQYFDSGADVSCPQQALGDSLPHFARVGER